jgi:hypothetical protein
MKVAVGSTCHAASSPDAGDNEPELIRSLARSFRAADSSLLDLFDTFESLGDCCEFNGLQLRHGVARPAFFNWRGTTIPLLMELIASDLAGVDTPGNLELRIHQPRPDADAEYTIFNRHDGSSAHTFEYVGRVDPDLLLVRWQRKLKLLRRKFLADVRSAQRIYLLRTWFPTEEAEVQHLADLLRRKGDNILLWVRIADLPSRTGKVQWLGPGLLLGEIDMLAPYEDAMAVKSLLWPRLLEQARQLANKRAELCAAYRTNRFA